MRWGHAFLPHSLPLVTKRTAVGPGVQRLAAVPAKALLRYFPGLQTFAHVLELRGAMVDVGGGAEVVEDLRGPLVALAEVGGGRLRPDVRDVCGCLACAA